MYTLLDNVKKYTYTELFDKLVFGHMRQIYIQEKQCYKKRKREYSVKKQI